MATQTIVVDDKPYVLLPRDEYDRLAALAKAADLPPLPEPDAEGNYPLSIMPAPVWSARSFATAWPPA